MWERDGRPTLFFPKSPPTLIRLPIQTVLYKYGSLWFRAGKGDVELTAPERGIAGKRLLPASG